MLLRILPILFLASAMFAQSPVASPIEAGVSQELAKWRAEYYSDVRYKLNLTLEKMSPVLKGTMEIRVKWGRRGVEETGSRGRHKAPLLTKEGWTPLWADGVVL